MNNLRLLTGLFAAALSSVGACAQGHRVVTLGEIFNVAEARSAQLRPAMTEQEEARREISVAKAGRLPDIDASLSVSYIGDGFTVKRNFSDYQKAPIPHFGNGFAVNISQPLYTGGAISGAIELAELKSTAARYAADFRRDNLRFQLTGYYLDIYKYTNLRRVVGANITAANQVLAEMKARFDQGTALRNDITRYELLVSNLELRMVQISNTLEILNTNLVTISGLPEGTVVVPDSTILSDALPKD
ncbi:MAG: TolC family protein, partial [Muribaculaceae bacterium]|nr:TolC family protein [Muribaculaceae bacterium]